MKIERPRFELTRVSSDGIKNAPEIVRVTQMPWDTNMDRRGFLGVGVGVAALLAFSSSSACTAPADYHNAHDGGVNVLAVTPDGKILASGSTDGIKLWSLPDGKLLKPLEGYKTKSDELLISADSKTLVSCSSDGVIKIWSLPEGNLVKTLENTTSTKDELVISADGKILAATFFEYADDIKPNKTKTTSPILPIGISTHRVKLWSLPEGNLLTALEGRKPAVTPDGKILISVSLDKIKLWSLPDAKPLNAFKASADKLAVSPDSKILVSGSPGGVVNLYSLPDGKILKTLTTVTGKVYDLTFTPDGKTLVIRSEAGIILLAMPEGNSIKTLKSSETETKAAIGETKTAVSPDGKTLALGFVGIKLHSLPDGDPVKNLQTKTVEALTFTPDGKILVSGNVRREIALWNLETMQVLAYLYDPNVRQDEPSENSSNSCPNHTSGGVGGYCSCNKVCTCIPVPSDRNAKESFEPTDQMLILRRLAELSVQKWNYKWDDASVRHIGPMAQDFAAAFGVGKDDRHIHPVDAQGVAFAAIQALYRILKEEGMQTQNLQAQLQQQREENKELKTRIEALEKLVKSRI